MQILSRHFDFRGTVYVCLATGSLNFEPDVINVQNNCTRWWYKSFRRTILLFPVKNNCFWEGNITVSGVIKQFTGIVIKLSHLWHNKKTHWKMLYMVYILFKFQKVKDFDLPFPSIRSTFIQKQCTCVFKFSKKYFI